MGIKTYISIFNGSHDEVFTYCTNHFAHSAYLAQSSHGIILHGNPPTGEFTKAVQNNFKNDDTQVIFDIRTQFDSKNKRLSHGLFLRSICNDNKPILVSEEEGH